ncbi:tautomerase [Halorubrum sp. SP3]|uniref:tautomerase family protein n=1 Tax=Halorubrum sp. SP3 TaxID=1537265 RepID=UPI0010F50205|nr:tautomerase family protein [Halorubrum sp. SP3]TKX53806.1 tautomerase [Halorubrum sp. SP3]
MPLLQFATTLSLSPAERESFVAFVTEEMETTAGHVAVTIAEHDPSAMAIGRAVEGPLLFLDAEIRGGRPFEYKRAFALAVMERAVEALGVPEPNCKVVFTEHAGEDMMGIDRVGGDWDGA